MKFFFRIAFKICLVFTILIFTIISYGCITQQGTSSKNDSTETTGCRSGWFKAKNNDTKLKLNRFCENESFEIFCPQESPKANGVCRVKWYLNAELVGELTTEYVDGVQTYEHLTFTKLKTEYPYYSETLTKKEWDQFSSDIKEIIYFEAAREKGNFNNGGSRYQYPKTLVQGETILDLDRYLKKHNKTD
jgi:hypothetical protein